MSGLERSAAWAPGASFFRDGDVIMFKFVLDSSSMVGPRKATKADQDQNPGEWQLFCRGHVDEAPVPAEAPDVVQEDIPPDDGGVPLRPNHRRRGRPPKER
jgi:hypothetical protein